MTYNMINYVKYNLINNYIFEILKLCDNIKPFNFFRNVLRTYNSLLFFPYKRGYWKGCSKG